MRNTLVALCATLLFANATHADSHPEPVIQGRPVSEWLGLSGGLALNQQDKLQADKVLKEISWQNRKAVAALFVAMRNEKWAIAYTASQRLREYGTNSVPLFVKGTADKNDNMRHASMAALARLEPISQNMIPLAVRALGDSYDQVTGQAVALLQRASRDHRDAVVRELVPILEGGNDALRLKAFMILEGMSLMGSRTKGEAMLSALASALSKTKYHQNAASALVGMGPESIPHLVEAVRNGAPGAARAGARALRQFDSSAKARELLRPYLDDLVHALQHKDVEVRAQSVYLVVGLAPDDPHLIPAIIEVLESAEHQSTRYSMATLIAKYPSAFDVAVPALASALQDKVWMVRGEAAESLRAFGAHSKSALPALHDLLQQTDRVDGVGTAEQQRVLEKARRSIQFIEHAVNWTQPIKTNPITSAKAQTLSSVLNARTNDTVTISLDANGTIRVEGRITVPAEIEKIAGSASVSNSTPFTIEAERSVQHFAIRSIMDSLSKQKFWKIKFRVKKETAQQRPDRD